MSECVLVHWTCSGLDEARQMSQFLVKEKLVACASITPWVESVYLWNDQMETSQESRVVMKTTKELFPKVKEAILKRCKYEVPEILESPIIDGHTEYLNWVKESCHPVGV
ncbi:MAG: divalent-cation tolerance protein CutA [Chlamydiales bacterium]|nr:divalent-cation tolerance protein CutA [Chlamydiales bacterium]